MRARIHSRTLTAPGVREMQKAKAVDLVTENDLNLVRQDVILFPLNVMCYVTFVTLS